MALVPGSQADGADQPSAESRPVLRWSVVCWVAVLVLIGVVQVMRGQWLDTALFFGAASLTAAGPWLPGREARRLPLGGAAGGTIIGAVIVFRWQARMTPGLRWLGIAWAAAFVVGCIWELSQFIIGNVDPGRSAYALSDLIDPLLDSLPGKVVFVAAWLAGGVLLLRRGTGKESRR